MSFTEKSWPHRGQKSVFRIAHVLFSNQWQKSCSFLTHNKTSYCCCYKSPKEVITHPLKKEKLELVSWERMDITFNSNSILSSKPKAHLCAYCVELLDRDTVRVLCAQQAGSCSVHFSLHNTIAFNTSNWENIQLSRQARHLKVWFLSLLILFSAKLSCPNCQLHYRGRE